MRKRKEKIVAIVQARMSSSRLPGKVMADICGKPMLYHVMKRVERSKAIDLAAVATSDHGEDDVIERFCREHAIACFRGSLDDVLDRYYQAALHFEAGAVVRLTADCPLLDPAVIDRVVGTFSEGRFDYASNILECTFPDGLDAEVISGEALGRAWQEARLKSEREHVTTYLRNHPEMFRLANVAYREDVSRLRWTVDEPRDLDFVRSVFGWFDGIDFGMEEILDLLKRHPELGEKNAGIERNEGYGRSLREDRVIR